MAKIIDFYEWKKKKAEEEAESEIKKVRTLRKELTKYLDEIDCSKSSTYVSEEFDSWTRKAIQVMLEALNRQKKWPIDSTDM